MIENNPGYQSELPPLVVRLSGDLGKLPASIGIQFPEQVGLMLIAKRLATPIGDVHLSPDLILDEDDMDQIGLGADYWRDLAIAA